MKAILIKQLIISWFCFSALIVSGQQNLSIYSMQAIPQSNYTNPALMPKSSFHIGAPGLSSVQVGIGNSGFNAHEVLEMRNDTTFFKFDTFLDALKPSNNIGANFDMEILSFGFKIKENHYFNFAVSTKFSTRFSYPKALFEFLYRGNGAFLGETMSFDKLGMKALHYNEAMIGYAFNVSEHLTIGAHFKAIQGLGNAETKKTNISILTQEDNFFITANADIEAYTSVLGFGIGRDSTYTDSFDPIAYATNTQNRGYGLDLGFNIKFNEKLSFGASVIDLGSITWTSDVVQFKSKNPNATYTYTGIEQGEMFDDNNNLNFGEQMNEVLDSIMKIFQLDTIHGGTYTTPLNTQFYFHTLYNLDKKTQLNAVLRIQSYQNTLFPKLQVGITRQVRNFLHLHGNYNIDRNSFANIGFGMATNLGPLQFYITTDNILSGIVYNRYIIGDINDSKRILIPRNTKHMNLRFGFNLIFGHKAKSPDKPLF